MKYIVNSFSAMSGVIISQWSFRWEAVSSGRNRYDIIETFTFAHVRPHLHFLFLRRVPSLILDFS